MPKKHSSIITFKNTAPYGITINIAELRDTISSKHSKQPDEDIRAIAGEEIEKIRQKVIGLIVKTPIINYQNCAVRAAISCLGELIKNSYDADANTLNLQLTNTAYSETPGWLVKITDDGKGFPPDHFEHYRKISSEPNSPVVYHDLRNPSTSSAARPYESAKTAGDRSAITGGANLGLRYLALTVQCDKQGTVLMKNRVDSSGAQITLFAGTEPACYGFDEIIAFRSEKGREPMSPDDIQRNSPPPPRPGSPTGW